MYKYLFKRVLDFIISSLLLILLFPFFILIGIVIKLTSNGPMIFVQQRLGRNFKIFYIYKFRTMIDNPREVNKDIFIGNNEVTFFGSFSDFVFSSTICINFDKRTTLNVSKTFVDL